LSSLNKNERDNNVTIEEKQMSLHFLEVLLFSSETLFVPLNVVAYLRARNKERRRRE
jgi:hypothetical protein